MELFLQAAEALHKSIVGPLISPQCDHYRSLQLLHEALLKTVREVTGKEGGVHPVERDGAGEVGLVNEPPRSGQSRFHVSGIDDPSDEKHHHQPGDIVTLGVGGNAIVAAMLRQCLGQHVTIVRTDVSRGSRRASVDLAGISLDDRAVLYALFADYPQSWLQGGGGWRVLLATPVS
ncbi:hypothetical protein [Mesorhizobium sp. M4A.F.Ca.ET.050.02.1.1]|uniref:hypothetical protein n=1 Tax=unclassified Mesorhizobium TaxID=325217 RepID=UPI0032AF450A